MLRPSKLRCRRSPQNALFAIVLASANLSPNEKLIRLAALLVIYLAGTLILSTAK